MYHEDCPNCIGDGALDAPCLYCDKDAPKCAVCDVTLPVMSCALCKWRYEGCIRFPDCSACPKVRRLEAEVTRKDAAYNSLAYEMRNMCAPRYKADTLVTAEEREMLYAGLVEEEKEKAAHNGKEPGRT